MRILTLLTLLLVMCTLLFSCKDEVEKSQIDLLTDSFWILDKVEGTNSPKFIEGASIQFDNQGRYELHSLGTLGGAWELDETKRQLTLTFVGTSVEHYDYEIITLDEKSLVLVADQVSHYFRHREDGESDPDANGRNLLTKGKWVFISKDGIDTSPHTIEIDEGTNLLFGDISGLVQQFKDDRFLTSGVWYLNPKIYQITLSLKYKNSYRIEALDNSSLVISRNGVTYTFGR